METTTMQKAVNEVKNRVQNATQKPQKEMKTTEPKPQQVETDAQKLQKEIELKKQELDRCLRELTRKKRLSDHLNKFNQTLSQIQVLRNDLNDPTEDFENTNLRVNFLANKHHSNPAFSIGNSELIELLFDFMEEKIYLKIKHLENELIKP